MAQFQRNDAEMASVTQGRAEGAWASDSRSIAPRVAGDHHDIAFWGPRGGAGGSRRTELVVVSISALLACT